MKSMNYILSILIMLAIHYGYAYTPAETNDVVRGMLSRLVWIGSHDNFPADGKIVIPGAGESPDTWEGFLGRVHDGRWTTEERKCAFDWYLSTLGTIDCQALSSMDQKLVYAALGRCNVFNYTNAVPSLRALALNPKGIHRLEAIEVVLKLSPVDDTTTSFIETVMTNIVGFSSVERGVACAVFADQLCHFSPTGAGAAAVKNRAVQMFYRNRNFGYDSAYLIDTLLVSSIEGYAMSSNRLETALTMLSKMEPDDFDRKDIIAITNRLISSGQPLRWINVRGNE